MADLPELPCKMIKKFAELDREAEPTPGMLMLALQAAVEEVPEECRDTCKIAYIETCIGGIGEWAEDPSIHIELHYQELESDEAYAKRVDKYFVDKAKREAAEAMRKAARAKLAEQKAKGIKPRTAKEKNDIRLLNKLLAKYPMAGPMQGV